MNSQTQTTIDTTDLAAELLKIGLRATASDLDDFLSRATRARVSPRELLEQIARAKSASQRHGRPGRRLN